MEKTVPIYTAEVTVIPCKKNTNNIIRKNPITLRNIVVKGFTSEDIFKRGYEKFYSLIHATKTSRKGTFIELKEMTLLRQHGMGVND